MTAGKQARPLIRGGMYDQKHVDRTGKLKNCVGYGPGTLGLALKPDDDAGVIDTLCFSEGGRAFVGRAAGKAALSGTAKGE